MDEAKFDRLIEAMADLTAALRADVEMRHREWNRQNGYGTAGGSVPPPPYFKQP